MTTPLSRRRATARRGAAAAERAIDAETRRQAEERSREAARLRASAAAARAARRRYVAADLDGVTHVHDGIGWRRVVKVNAKSVTVATPYSWTDRLTYDQIHHIHTEEDA